MVESVQNDSIGVLTLATPSDAHKALAMACSCRLRSPELPLAVAAAPEILEKLGGVFDHLIPERTDLRGFEHKLHLDEYSPFERTLFIDADMLVMGDPLPLMERWRGRSYMARGHYVSGGRSSFGLERKEIQQMLGSVRMVKIDGAGHAYFEKPACLPIFQRAREIRADYDRIAPAARLADEDVMAIVMTELGLPPIDDDQVVGFPESARRATLKLDAMAGECTYIDVRGERITPTLLHFARNQCPLLYHHQMRRLASVSKDLPAMPWRRLAWRDWWHVEVEWRARRYVRFLLTLIGLRAPTPQDTKA